LDAILEVTRLIFMARVFYMFSRVYVLYVSLVFAAFSVRVTSCDTIIIIIIIIISKSNTVLTSIHEHETRFTYKIKFK